MRTKPQLENKIAELKAWLLANSSEHEARPQIEADLREAVNELAKLDSNE